LSEKRYAIVGIDPGSTIGVAAIDLSGKRIYAGSFRNEGISEAARIIEQHCTPSLFACDTNPAPEAAQRLASYFSCRLSVPRQNVREEEKKSMARGAGVENAHERDAFSAAVLAWRQHQNRLRQIDALEGLPQAEKERVKHLLLRGVRVQDAFMMLREAEETAQGAHVREKALPAMKSASPDELRARLESLARENANLRLALERLEEEKAALMHRLRLMENGVRESVMRDSEFRKLRFQLQNAMAKLQRGLPASEPRGSDPMNRIKWHKKPKQKQQAPVQKKQEEPARGKEESASKSWRVFAAPAAKSERSEEINSGEPEIDLERLVADYRKGRK